MADIYKRVKRGNDILVNVHTDPIDGYHMTDMLWDIEFFTKENGNRIKIKKTDAHKVDDDNYLCPIVTSTLEEGILWATIKTRVPSDYFEDGYQDEAVDFQVDRIILY